MMCCVPSNDSLRKFLVRGNLKTYTKKEIDMYKLAAKQLITLCRRIQVERDVTFLISTALMPLQEWNHFRLAVERALTMTGMRVDPQRVSSSLEWLHQNATAFLDGPQRENYLGYYIDLRFDESIKFNKSSIFDTYSKFIISLIHHLQSPMIVETRKIKENLSYMANISGDDMICILFLLLDSSKLSEAEAFRSHGFKLIVDFHIRMMRKLMMSDMPDLTIKRKVLDFIQLNIFSLQMSIPRYEPVLELLTLFVSQKAPSKELHEGSSTYLLCSNP